MGGVRDLIPEFTRMMKSLKVLNKNMKVHDLLYCWLTRETCERVNLYYGSICFV